MRNALWERTAKIAGDDIDDDGYDVLLQCQYRNPVFTESENRQQTTHAALPCLARWSWAPCLAARARQAELHASCACGYRSGNSRRRLCTDTSSNTQPSRLQLLLLNAPISLSPQSAVTSWPNCVTHLLHISSKPANCAIRVSPILPRRLFMCLHAQNSSAALRDLVRYAIIADKCEDVNEDVNTKIEPTLLLICCVRMDHLRRLYAWVRQPLGITSSMSPPHPIRWGR